MTARIPPSELPQVLQQAAPGAHISLDVGEFIGQLTIEKPVTLEGRGSGTWLGNQTTVIVVRADGVTLRNLEVEVVGDPGASAIVIQTNLAPVLDDVRVRRGNVVTLGYSFTPPPLVQLKDGPLARRPSRPTPPPSPAISPPSALKPPPIPVPVPAPAVSSMSGLAPRLRTTWLLMGLGLVVASVLLVIVTTRSGQPKHASHESTSARVDAPAPMRTRDADMPPPLRPTEAVKERFRTFVRELHGERAPARWLVTPDGLTSDLEPAAEPRFRRVVIAPSARSAWVAAELSADVQLVRASAFLTLESGRWKVDASQWSAAREDVQHTECAEESRPAWEFVPDVPPATRNAVDAVLESLVGAKQERFRELLSASDLAFAWGSDPDDTLEGARIRDVIPRWWFNVENRNNSDPPARAGVDADGDLMWMSFETRSTPGLCSSYQTFYVLANESGEWRIVHQHYAAMTLP